MSREQILAALDELTEAELRRLKAALGRLPLAPGYAAIARSRLEAADALDLTDLLVGHYREGYGAAVPPPPCAAPAASTWPSRSPPPPPPPVSRAAPVDPEDPVPPAAAAAPRGPRAKQQHFVERHRAELIERVPAVEPLLDLLQGEVLDAEQARAVAAEATPQGAMRRLLLLAPSWTPRCKERVLAALRRRHPALVAELEARDAGDA
ncbi:apoptosis-associated speck-like protein containing a CARD [Apteryx mantelli]|uniref:Apoptosis-associated speck-like protein containing a CARD n=1 Tax=Apteryx mantelli TaxID=2696672 RepID=A0ABM4G6Q2_9AVES